jgi:hypothetical protein
MRCAKIVGINHFCHGTAIEESNYCRCEGQIPHVSRHGMTKSLTLVSQTRKDRGTIRKSQAVPAQGCSGSFAERLPLGYETKSVNVRRGRNAFNSMRTSKISVLILLTQLAFASPGYSFTNLGQTYTVNEGVTFNQINPDYLVGNLNVKGTYNIFGDGFFPTLYVNNLNVSGSFNNNGGTVVNSNGYYYSNFDVLVTPTGTYNQTGGYLWQGVDVTNQGMFQVSGGSINYTPHFQNAGNLTIDGGSVYIGTLNNTGVINANQRFYFGDILDLNISNSVVTDINGKAGLILNYDAERPANAYLGHNDFLLSGQGGLLTHFTDVVSVTTDKPYSLTLHGGAKLSFDFWWDMGVEPPPFQPGYNFDVLALQGGTAWQSIGQISAYSPSTGWNTASFTLPPGLGEPGTQIQFVLTDYSPETAPVVYLRAIATPDSGGAALMLMISLAGVFLFWQGQRRSV